MIVTDLEFALENRLVDKLMLLTERCVKARKDSLVICEGAEGEGKTNSSLAMAYCVKWLTGRDIHLFFRLESMMKFAQNTEDKIIIWDEPALDSLSSDWYKEMNKDLIRLLMTCRKKRHFIIINMVKFFKFSEYVVVDRALGLMHMYSRDGVIAGRFLWVKKKNLEHLWLDYRFKKMRAYKKHSSFGGAMPLVMDRLESMGVTIEGKPNASLLDYEELKSRAIESIGSKKPKNDKFHVELKELKKSISNLTYPIFTQNQMAENLGITRTTIIEWRKGNPDDKNV